MTVAFAAALQTAEVGKREPGQRNVGAGRFDRRQDRERVRHPMLAGLRNGEGQLALEQRCADQAAAALGRDRMDGVHVGIAAAESDDAVGAPPRGLDQPVAVRGIVGDDGDPFGLDPFEDLRLGVGDRLFRSEIFDMGGSDRRDQCNVRADLRRRAR